MKGRAKMKGLSGSVVVFLVLVVGKGTASFQPIDNLQRHFQEIACKLHQANMRLFPHQHQLLQDPCANLTTTENPVKFDFTIDVEPVNSGQNEIVNNALDPKTSTGNLEPTLKQNGQSNSTEPNKPNYPQEQGQNNVGVNIPNGFPIQNNNGFQMPNGFPNLNSNGFPVQNNNGYPNVNPNQQNNSGYPIQNNGFPNFPQYPNQPNFGFPNMQNGPFPNFNPNFPTMNLPNPNQNFYPYPQLYPNNGYPYPYPYPYPFNPNQLQNHLPQPTQNNNGQGNQNISPNPNNVQPIQTPKNLQPNQGNLNGQGQGSLYGKPIPIKPLNIPIQGSNNNQIDGPKTTNIQPPQSNINAQNPVNQNVSSNPNNIQPIQTSNNLQPNQGNVNGQGQGSLYGNPIPIQPLIIPIPVSNNNQINEPNTSIQPPQSNINNQNPVNENVSPNPNNIQPIQTSNNLQPNQGNLNGQGQGSLYGKPIPIKPLNIPVPVPVSNNNQINGPNTSIQPPQSNINNQNPVNQIVFPNPNNIQPIQTSNNLQPNQGNPNGQGQDSLYGAPMPIKPLIIPIEGSKNNEINGPNTSLQSPQSNINNQNPVNQNVSPNPNNIQPIQTPNNLQPNQGNVIGKGQGDLYEKPIKIRPLLMQPNTVQGSNNNQANKPNSTNTQKLVSPTQTINPHNEKEQTSQVSNSTTEPTLPSPAAAIIFPDSPIVPEPTESSKKNIVFPDNELAASYLQEPGGRSLLNAPKTGKNESVIVSTAAPALTVTTSRSRASTRSHSSWRRNHNDDYSTEEDDDDQRRRKYESEEYEEVDSAETTTIDPSEVVTVKIGKRILSNVKTNCPDGWIADRKGVCREPY
ncbi:unnamed protein product [Phyllotreta striolata]|uniref:Uncharacterized protein n=1 Tax=Phyllotreta striolata TaxID=444603 RepID=A0A9N9TA00_PHYSR|nr:unnamed protein product [Phyllotreta striolata]